MEKLEEIGQSPGQKQDKKKDDVDRYDHLSKALVNKLIGMGHLGAEDPQILRNSFYFPKFLNINNYK